MDYGKILSRAWQIAWRWKVLWILGFLASLGQGLGGGNGSSYQFNSSDWGRVSPNIAPAVIGLLIALACLAVIIGIALWVVSIMARGGLIAGVQQVEDEGSTRFVQAWRVGRGRFWTLFGITILASIPTFIAVLIGVGVLVLLIVGTVGAFNTSEGAGAAGVVASVLCGGTLCCGAIVLAVVLEQIRVYAERAAILEGLGWIEAFKRGWQVLKENLGPTIILWIIFAAIGFVFAAVILGGLFALLAPFFALLGTEQLGPWILVPFACGGLIAAIIFALIRSVIETFTSASWTLAYRELTGLAAPAAAIPPAAAEPPAAEVLPAES
jgi:hypothetical protein